MQPVSSLSVQSVSFLSVQSVSSLIVLFPLCAACFLFVQSVSSLPVQSVSSLSVQSVSSLTVLFPLCVCNLFPSLPQWRCGTNNGHIYTLSASLHATFSKLPFVSHTQSQDQKLRQAFETV